MYFMVERITNIVFMFIGYLPIIGANVKAFVTLSESQVLQILYDDGVGADVKANDGVYSAFFTRLQGSGRYGAKVC